MGVSIQLPVVGGNGFRVQEMAEVGALFHCRGKCRALTGFSWVERESFFHWSFFTIVPFHSTHSAH